MIPRTVRIYILSALLAVVAAGGVVLALLQQRCAVADGTFDWIRAACEAKGRPVILQGDIHRV